jgi:hypothetical protein
MAFSFDMIGSAVFCLSEVYILVITVNMVRFSLASRGEKNSNHPYAHGLMEMHIQICVKLTFEN